jgi:hypothetical protein
LNKRPGSKHSIRDGFRRRQKLFELRLTYNSARIRLLSGLELDAILQNKANPIPLSNLEDDENKPVKI